MKFALVADDRFELHRTASHPERPERLQTIRRALKAQDLSVERFAPREATDEELETCHTPAVWQKVKELTEQGAGHIDHDTYINEHSDRAARLAAGAGIDLCRAVLRGEFDRGFLLARPPGHHAESKRSMGFCLYSTVAIAVKNCADLADRILVLDWDVHHGNGTQDCLYGHGGSCFVSLHQTRFYPGTGYADERGEGPGEGSIYNIPLPAGCGDKEYEEAYKRLVRPIIRRYDPQLIVVSAGYDAHRSDHLAMMDMSCDGFAAFSQWALEDALACSANGRIVGFLEGGYNLDVIAEAVPATISIWSEKTAFQKKLPGKCNDQVKRFVVDLASRFEL